MKKIWIVVDMQEDFISGVLSNENAQRIVPKICDLVKNLGKDDVLIFTQDTHNEDDYYNTIEGKILPMHCDWMSSGWHVNKSIIDSANENSNLPPYITIEKQSFGYEYWYNELNRLIEIEGFEEVHICGTVTEICVINNALEVATAFPAIPIFVHANLCAGLTEEGHNSALKVMKTNFINVVEGD